MNEEHFTDEVSYFFMTHILYIYIYACIKPKIIQTPCYPHLHK